MSIPSRRVTGSIRIGALLALAVIAGCAANGDGSLTTPATPDATVEASARAATPEPTTAAGAPAEIDVCALLSQAEVEGIASVPIGAAAAEDPLPPFFGCRYEDPDITPVITVGILAWDSPSDAESSFGFGADQHRAVDGIGDRAYRSQPIDDITVLQGRYEVSVGLYFVSEDEDTDFEVARQLAEIVIGRLP